MRVAPSSAPSPAEAPASGRRFHSRLDTLPITAEHAWVADALPHHHRDPSDRMLVAQAQLEGFAIVTRDPKITAYQVAVLAA